MDTLFKNYPRLKYPSYWRVVGVNAAVGSAIFTALSGRWWTFPLFMLLAIATILCNDLLRKLSRSIAVPKTKAKINCFDN